MSINHLSDGVIGFFELCQIDIFLVDTQKRKQCFAKSTDVGFNSCGDFMVWIMPQGMCGHMDVVLRLVLL